MLKEFEVFLAEQIIESNIVSEAMNYALLAGGKRVRPQLLLTLLQDLGIDYKKGFKAASSLEMIHTYSLIHDDLPAMDNDDYRRGQLTVHKKYDEAIAILAGDALLTKAFATIINDDLSPLTNIELVNLLSEYSCYQGMIYGQELDLTGENACLDLVAIQKIHYYKTGKLITLAMLLALVIADREELSALIIKLGQKLGLAFQIQDDIFDATKTYQQLGKYSSDAKNQKTTYVSVLGVTKAQSQLDKLFTEVISLHQQLNLPTNHLLDCIMTIKEREK